jgi:electron transport complex protein RnfC
MGIIDFFTRRSFGHGIHPPELKAATRDRPIRRMPFAPKLYVPLSQHVGAPAVPIVYPGQEVRRGEPIARSDGYLSVPMHAPASGVIQGVELMPTVRGPKAEAIILKVYPGASQEVLHGSHQDVESMSPEELVRAVQETGSVGLGGAGFPTHVKLNVPPGHRIDTVLINGCECEPYLTTDHRVMLEWPEKVIAGTRIVRKIVGAERAVIGVEDNKLDAAAALRAKLPAGEPISVGVMRTKYPQGAEKLMIKALLGREVPSGGFPYHVGVGVYNVGTVAQLGELLPHGQGLIERVVTITGPGIKKPGNYLIPIGTPMGFVLQSLGYEGGARHLILGGPMMGTSVSSLDVPVTKPVSGILALTAEEVASERQGRVYPCIRCGKCVEACPMHLNPSRLGLLATKLEYTRMEQDYNLNDCFECGCCSFVCPSNIPLVQYFRIAKSINRDLRQRQA